MRIRGPPSPVHKGGCRGEATNASWAPPVSFKILLPPPSSMNVTKENSLNQDQTALGLGFCGSLSGTKGQASHSHPVITEGKSSVSWGT